jgi:hypothetical protein
MLVVKKKMSTIKQPNKGDNVRQNPNNITQLFKNNNSKNVIKIVFDVDLHHGPIRVKVEKVWMPKGMTSQPLRVNTPI